MNEEVEQAKKSPFNVVMLVLVLAVVVSLILLARQQDAQEPANWAMRQARHELQTAACLKAAGVPFFDSRNGHNILDVGVHRRYGGAMKCVTAGDDSPVRRPDTRRGKAASMALAWTFSSPFSVAGFRRLSSTGGIT
jgi:hypothetical protein